MFWKLIEIIVRILFWRRFAKAKKIGAAATLLSEGNPHEALIHLEKHGNGVHQTLIPLFAFTQAKIYAALNRLEDAENSYKAVILTNPKDARADLELAILTGRQFRFEDCRTWLIRAIEKDDDGIKKRAEEILTLLDAIENGAKQKEYEQRAIAMSEKALLNFGSVGIPPNMDVMKQWLSSSPEALETVDDCALLVAYGEVEQGGTWKIGLSIEDTLVIKPDQTEFSPFEIIAPFLPIADQKQTDLPVQFPN